MIYSQTHNFNGKHGNLNDEFNSREVHRRHIQRFLDLKGISSTLVPQHQSYIPLADWRAGFNIIEDKTDSHSTGNLAIELVGNLLWPAVFDRIYAHESLYSPAVEYHIFNQPRDKQVFLHPVQPNHYTSYYFKNTGQILILNTQALQVYLKIALNNEWHDLIGVTSRREDSNNEWHSINMLIPVEKIRDLSIIEYEAREWEQNESENYKSSKERKS